MTATTFLPTFWKFPNLGQRAARYWGYLVDRYVFRTDGSKDFAATEGERFWLLLYAPASFLYRLAVMLDIAIFIAAQYLAVGVIDRDLGPADGRGAAYRQGAVAGDR